jgi:hypothetical protein
MNMETWKLMKHGLMKSKWNMKHETLSETWSSSMKHGNMKHGNMVWNMKHETYETWSLWNMETWNIETWRWHKHEAMKHGNMA